MDRTSGVQQIGGVAPGVPEVGLSVTGRVMRAGALACMLSILAVVAFFGGRALARNMDSGDLTASGQEPVQASSVSAEPGNQEVTDGNSTAPLEVSGRSVGETLRFVPFKSQTAVIDAETSPELNNSVGVDASTLDPSNLDRSGLDSSDLDDLEVRALVVDLVVRGPGGSSVSVHPGDRPGDAVRFTIPGGGRLLVPHLIAPTDEEGRVVVSAGDQVEVTMTGIGQYVPAASADAGRFVATGSVQIGSLVTATDGRTLTMALSDVLGDDAEQVGQAVVRLNANVGRDGGSVAVGDGPPIPWPGPANPDLGLAGTELLTVTPDDDGVITMTYLGGSVMTVDLVGFYTNRNAVDTTEGLLVLAPRPSLQTIEVEPEDGQDGRAEQDVQIGIITDGEQAATESAAETEGLGRSVAIIEAANGETGGAIRFWTEPGPRPDTAAFALAPGQQRNTTEWFAPGQGPASVSAPNGATLTIWTIGRYTGPPS